MLRFLLSRQIIRTITYGLNSYTIDLKIIISYNKEWNFWYYVIKPFFLWNGTFQKWNNFFCELNPLHFRCLKVIPDTVWGYKAFNTNYIAVFWQDPERWEGILVSINLLWLICWNLFHLFIFYLHIFFTIRHVLCVWTIQIVLFLLQILEIKKT